jgi:hypothetical protein
MRFAGQINAPTRPKLNAIRWPKTMRFAGQIDAPSRPKIMRICTGGKAAAIHLSFMASCKANKINPVEYLTDVFSRINDLKTSELEQLLPNRWAKSRRIS